MCQVDRDLVAELGRNFFQSQSFGLGVEEVHERCAEQRDDDEDEIVFPIFAPRLVVGVEGYFRTNFDEENNKSEGESYHPILVNATGAHMV
jgi:hypothetical protein